MGRLQQSKIQPGPAAQGDDQLFEIPGVGKVTFGQLNRSRWETGVGLEELLDETQMEIELARRALKRHGKMFVKASRKIGKTFWAMVAVEIVARGQRNAIIRMAFPTKEQGKTIIIPVWEEVLESCPLDMRWQNREATDGCWYLPLTNARLYLCGTDDKAQIDRLRGPRSTLTILDEVTFFSTTHFRYLVQSVLGPQLVGTGGNIIFTGTPPDSMDHPSVSYIERAERQGNLIVRTIWDNKRLSRDDIRLICAEANPDATEEEVEEILDGKREGTAEWEREYLCRMVSNKELRVVPEFDEKRHVATFDPPVFADRFVFGDSGHAGDFFASVFCRLDFAAQKLLVEHEYESKRKPTDEVVKDLQKIEAELWPAARRESEHLLRLFDCPPQMATDFNAKGYKIRQAPKSPGKEELVREMQNRMHGNHILVHPRCKSLIVQLRDGIFVKKGDGKLDFMRSKKHGHLDALDGLANGVRNMSWRHNPAPPGVYQRPDSYVIAQDVPRSKNAQAIASAFGGLFNRSRFARAR